MSPISVDNQSTVDGQSSTTTAVEPVRISRYDQYVDLRTFQVTLRKTKKVIKKRKRKEPPVVLVVRRIIDDKGRHKDTEVDIKSAPLTRALIEVNKGVPGLRLTGKSPVAHPRLFFLSYKGLESILAEERKKANPDEELIQGLTVALDYTLEDFAETMADFEKLTSQEEITFDLLWALIPPLTYVYNYHGLTDQPQVLQTQSFSVGRRDDGSIVAFIECNVIHDNGSAFGLANVQLEIGAFEGTRNIQDLPVFPLKFHKDGDRIRESCIMRGKRFAAMVKPGCYECSGPSVREQISSGRTSSSIFFTRGRVMIDPVAFRIFEPNCFFNFRVTEKLDRCKLTDDQYMICSPILLGFSLGSKIWGAFAIDRLEEVVWSDEPFDSLVLGQKQKELIHALVKQHSARSEHFDDVVRGKGKGLVGLLSGNPGCGKTLTAEAVAEVLHQPLYVASAGELGTGPEDLDRRLGRILELAQTWNAVLLLDEAEVFLQKRDTADVTRNALVSIFLRQLEYYQGVLIMTTNLVAYCDPAFESRIHFSVHYQDLDFKARRNVWKSFIIKTKKSMKDASVISNEDLDCLATHNLNGRQIKNIVSNALSIALERGSYMRKEHIDSVLEVVEEWKATTTDTYQESKPGSGGVVKLAQWLGMKQQELMLILQRFPYAVCAFLLMVTVTGWLYALLVLISVIVLFICYLRLGLKL